MSGASPKTSAGLHVLIVEDDAGFAQSMALLLGLKGHRVEIAPSGPAGVETARGAMPDVVLLDIGLPGMSGYDVARALRADPALSGAHLIAISGYGQEEDQRHALQAGFDRHLTKPFDMDTLEQILAGLP
jgi:CheY-like chemotaxis protein